MLSRGSGANKAETTWSAQRPEASGQCHARSLDLPTIDRHPLASVGSLVLGLRCTWCGGAVPMRKITGLHAMPLAPRAGELSAGNGAVLALLSQTTAGQRRDHRSAVADTRADARHPRRHGRRGDLRRRSSERCYLATKLRRCWTGLNAASGRAAPATAGDAQGYADLLRGLGFSASAEA